MKFTIIGDWYTVRDLASSFAVVAEGDTYEESKANAAASVLERFPQRADGDDGETSETLWGGDCGACVVGVFVGDLSGAAAGRLQSLMILDQCWLAEPEESQWPLEGAEGHLAESGGDVGVAGCASRLGHEGAHVRGVVHFTGEGGEADDAPGMDDEIYNSSNPQRTPDTDGVLVLDDSSAPRRIDAAGPWRLSDELRAAGTVSMLVNGQRRCSIRFKGWVLDNRAAAEFSERPFAA
ncbi:hypothetical protein [Streptomyces sp. NBC_00154]|uniref:hypothetical protein n=1 Tax=Streptomyces sp. NBC_00154 TaxID=2975670 RepID=UPI002256942E|nr:hypothetical protein [Streptomyces sp. NBC_00154]MCX5318141.1 hypothetical protein [Streptomyces sp. NBC_00154]